MKPKGTHTILRCKAKVRSETGERESVAVEGVRRFSRDRPYIRHADDAHNRQIKDIDSARRKALPVG